MYPVDVYLKSTMEAFVKIAYGFQPVTIFAKKLHHRFSTCFPLCQGQ